MKVANIGSRFSPVCIRLNIDFSKMYRNSFKASETTPPDNILDMLNMISDLQSERMDSQRAELRPVQKPSKVNKATSLPGLRPLQTTSTRPEDDFMEIIARVQGSRLDDQRSELPAQKPKERPPLDDDFFSLIMRAQSGRMEDQRASIPFKESTGNKASNSKK
ncbi:unnamed protein product [Euphydryas editha]|uniref:G-protein-signaling modulator 2 n=1 Tax=Euphydryas editha TaxID=104508 RepID=A0AAU9UWJ5_EUPED|nr:unnamed protein product [Euphydryas editha]